MDALSSIFSWLSDHEAGISAVVGITVLAGVMFAGLRALVRRRGQASRMQTPSASAEIPALAEASRSDLDPLSVPGFDGRAAIAVLRFDNLSGDPEQEYFADGIAEDLITRLSAWRDFPVIARNSSFTYDGRPADVKQVGRELGVRYVVEGSVRKVDERVRIGAQLIDATTAAHVWAEHYDRKLEDIFATQDEITAGIVASIYPELVRSEGERVARKEPQNLDAWDHAVRGGWHFIKFTKEDTAKARSHFERAGEIPDMQPPLPV